MGLEYILSSKNEPRLSYDNFLYIKDCKRGNNIKWKCQNSYATRRKCKASIKSDNTQILNVSEIAYNHYADSLYIKTEKVEEKICKLAMK